MWNAGCSSYSVTTYEELRKHICLNNLYTCNINLIVYLHV
jgi:hypothetical protein